jgi:hypothetical protein
MTKRQLPPVLMDCPGEGGNGNLACDGYAQCQYCNDRLALLDGVIPPHPTHDILAMIERGDFG